MKLLIENWRKFLTEISAPEAKWFGPAFQAIADDPSVLVSAWDKEGKVIMRDDGWILENIGPFIGSGYSRTAYGIKGRPDLVFKIAIAVASIDEGRYTNGEEKKMFNKYPEFFPRVWMTSEHVETSPHIRAMTHSDKGKVAKADNLYIDWIIVDRVKQLDREGLDEILRKKFPILDQIIKETPWRGRRTSNRLGLSPLSPNFRASLFSRFLYSLESNNPYHRFGIGGLTSFLDKHLPQKEAQAIIQNIWDTMVKDHKLAKVFEVISAAGMRTDEVRVGNLGTDIATGTKLIFLDINRFLYKHGATDP